MLTICVFTIFVSLRLSATLNTKLINGAITFFPSTIKRAIQASLTRIKGKTNFLASLNGRLLSAYRSEQFIISS